MDLEKLQFLMQFDKYFASKEKTFEDCTIERISQKREILLISLNYKV